VALLRQKAALLLILAVAAVIVMPATADDPPTEVEVRVKAAFLYNFAKFVHWPTDAFDRAGAPLIIAVVGEDPFGPVLERTLEGKRVGRRKVLIRRYPEAENIGFCHVLFISQSESARLEAILERMKDISVLTVGDSPGYLDRGVVVNMVLVSGKVRFEINTDAAEHNNLRISSKLLSLARNMQDAAP
jgi:hypothetical protein